MNSKVIDAIILYWYPYVGALQPIYKAIFSYLQCHGFTVNIIAGIPHYRKGRKELWPNYKGVFYQKTTEDGFSVTRTFVLSPKANIIFDESGFLRRFINYFSFFISALIVLLRTKHKPDIIFIPSFPPFFSGALICLVSAFKKISFVYNVQDIYPETLAMLKLFRNKCIRCCMLPLMIMIETVEKMVYRRAKHITVISATLRNMLQKKGVPAAKISVIPNFCDTDIFKPHNKVNEFSEEYALHNKFIVLFAGNMGEPQGIEFIIEAARLLQYEHGIRFVLVGRGEKKEAAEERVKQYNLANVTFIPLQPYERMPLVWASADVSLISLRKDLSRIAFPSKTYCILASGRPIIAMLDKNSDNWQWIERSGGGVCVESEDAQGLAREIMALYKAPVACKAYGERGRAFVVKHYSKDAIVQQYKQLFDGLCVKENEKE